MSLNIKLMMYLADKAAKRSNCKRAQVGAVVALTDPESGYTITSTGYNHNPSGPCECGEGKTRPDTTHAEIHALTDTAIDWAGATMFISRRPCLECAQAIVKAGITTVYHKDAGSKQAGLDYLNAQGITVIQEWLTPIEYTQQAWHERWSV